MTDSEKGLYSKYIVHKNDLTPVYDCFVLRPDKDPAAVVALKAYAAATENKKLADDIYSWVGRPSDENQPFTLILPARVGDSIVVKDGDSTDTLRIDGFELRGDELMVWGEGENERYASFSQHEIIKYIPKEEVENWDNQ